jgi:hypothetical protein
MWRPLAGAGRRAHCHMGAALSKAKADAMIPPLPSLFPPVPAERVA